MLNGDAAAAVRLADDMAWVCREADSLRAALPANRSQLLDTALSAIRDDTFALIGSSLGALFDALAQVGIGRDPGRSHTVTGAPMPRPAETVFLCPLRRCTQARFPADDRSVPRCAASGESLRESPIRE